jgi:electron transport complex protein RnfA
MTDLLLLVIGASLVNNFVLTGFLGLCPFVGVSGRFEAAAGMALATLFVMTLASGLGYAAFHWLLDPLGLGYLRTLVFILLIAAVVQLTELIVRATSPLLHQLVYGASAATGFGLALLLFAALRERVDGGDAPAAFRGAPIALVTAGLMALAFMGFAGLGSR